MKRYKFTLHCCVLTTIWLYGLITSLSRHDMPMELVVTGLMRITLVYVLFFVAMGWIVSAFKITRSDSDRKSGDKP